MEVKNENRYGQPRLSQNLVDSEVMLGIIKDKQLEITNDPADAELIIVNTCGLSKVRRRNPSAQFYKWRNIRRRAAANI